MILERFEEQTKVPPRDFITFFGTIKLTEREKDSEYFVISFGDEKRIIPNQCIMYHFSSFEDLCKLNKNEFLIFKL